MTKMYGSYSDEDLNEWEKFNAILLTSSAFGAWLMRRDEKRDKRKLEQAKAELALEQEPCEDCISRAEAIEALGEEPPVWYDETDEIAERNQWRRDVAAIEALPSVKQEPKAGHLSNKDWVDLLTEQFNVSRTSAKEMLHAMMSVKKEDNFKKQFSGGCNVFNNSKR